MHNSTDDQTIETKVVEMPFLNLLSAEHAALIINHSNVVRYKPRDVIFLQNTRTSHIMFVKSGLVKIYKEGKNGRTLILRLETPSNFLGLMSVFGSDIHQYSASAIEQTEIYFIDINAFRQILSNNLFVNKLLNMLSMEGLFMFERLINQSHKQLPGRIADVLLYFAEKIYHTNSFILPFTRRELAEFAGTTKESFIRTLTEFKNDKIIELDGSKVEIRSLKIIRTLSDLG